MEDFDLTTKQGTLDFAEHLEEDLYTMELTHLGPDLMGLNAWLDENWGRLPKKMHGPMKTVLCAARLEMSRALIDDLYIRSNFFCVGCGVDVGDEKEYASYTDDTQSCSGLDFENMKCVGCIEEDLGRTLVYDDFRRCPLNDEELGWNPKSDRLKDRLASK